MKALKNIRIDLDTFKILLQGTSNKDLLTIHFDKPSRKFYLSLIALIVINMQQKGKTGFVYIRKHEKILRQLDIALAGQYASKSIHSMWEKIRKAWHYTLTDLEAAAHFKITDRDLLPPFEKGGRYSYDCTEKECDLWASLFEIDNVSNKWRFKFAVDTVKLSLADISITFGTLTGQGAWNAFLASLAKEMNTLNPGPGSIAKENHYNPQGPHIPDPTQHVKKRFKHPWYWGCFAVVTMVVLGIMGIAMLNRNRHPEQTMMPLPPGKYAIAVLPFVNISADPKQEYFCDGISEELINSLAGIKDLRVVSRTSSFFFKGKSMSTRTIGKQLNVDAVLEGGVRFEGDKMRVTARLVNAKDDMNLWAATFDRKSKNLLAIQEDISRAIVNRLRLEMLADNNWKTQSAQSLDAYHFYLKGRFFWEQMSFEKAVAYFEKAITTDPNHALAYTGLSDTYHLMALFLEDPARTYAAKASKAAQKALALDPTIAESQVSLGWIKFHFDWDWQGADKAFKKAVELKPNLATAHRCYGAYLIAMGRRQEALEESRTALELDPLSPFSNMQHGLLLNILDRSDEAIHRLKSNLDLYPDHSDVMLNLGLSYLFSKTIDQGILLIEKVGQHFEPKSPLVQGYLAHAYAISGNNTRARTILNNILKQRDQGYVSPHAIAVIYTGLGEIDKAFQWLDTAVEERDPPMHNLKSTMVLRPLHTDPRWPALLKSMDLK